jgi:hypothetical protein
LRAASAPESCTAFRRRCDAAPYIFLLRPGLFDEPTVENMLTWQAAGGFSFDASVRISGSDYAGR